ncbi:MAG TPA: endolytic transglycosylase MltG [Candidatus Acidoferrum sp.]|nr:endolytic transglycosylase MltG [Candidatus Acidoferrum sp.]
MAFRRTFVRLLLVVFACATAVGGFEAWRALTPTDALAAGPRVVDIPAQQGVLTIARRLRDAEVIPSAEAFVALGVVRGTARSLRAGEYEFPQGTTAVSALRMLESGKVRLHPVLHPEGATVAELARTIDKQGLARADDVLRAASDPAFLRSVGIEAASLEGYVFPDTYYFTRGLTAEQMLTRTVQRLRAKLTAEVVARARARGLDVHRLLTLASIIEREAVVQDERRLIAAVFWNRLQLGMPLQADPTVQYAVGKERRALTRADLASEHPFNTYTHTGLPPGPIASPGLAVIEATLDPAPVNYLYFVASDDHRHRFSTTVEEHNAAVARYRLARPR